MRDITKRAEPASLTTYRAQPGAVYDGADFTPVKDDIRDGLLREQGFLCCYCMSRITARTMRVEHWHCQRSYLPEQLDYANMLGACPGNEGHPPPEQHCDVRKADSELALNPADPAHNVESRLRYLGDGTVASSDALFQQQIEAVLNLNMPLLKRNRKAVVTAIHKALARRPSTRTRGQIRRLLEAWSSQDGEGRLREFCGVAVFWLNKRLRRS